MARAVARKFNSDESRPDAGFFRVIVDIPREVGWVIFWTARARTSFLIWTFLENPSAEYLLRIRHISL
jgi:hypothetical protein